MTGCSQISEGKYIPLPKTCYATHRVWDQLQREEGLSGAGICPRDPFSCANFTSLLLPSYPALKSELD